MPLIMRLTDTSDHGGEIVTSAERSLAEGQKIARKGDILNCPIHGPQPIVSGSDNVLCEGKEVARHGVDTAACGAVLISRATKTIVN